MLRRKEEIIIRMRKTSKSLLSISKQISKYSKLDFLPFHLTPSETLRLLYQPISQLPKLTKITPDFVNKLVIEAYLVFNLLLNLFNFAVKHQLEQPYKICKIIVKGLTRFHKALKIYQNSFGVEWEGFQQIGWVSSRLKKFKTLFHGKENMVFKKDGILKREMARKREVRRTQKMEKENRFASKKKGNLQLSAQSFWEQKVESEEERILENEGFLLEKTVKREFIQFERDLDSQITVLKMQRNSGKEIKDMFRGLRETAGQNILIRATNHPPPKRVKSQSKEAPAKKPKSDWFKNLRFLKLGKPQDEETLKLQNEEKKRLKLGRLRFDGVQSSISEEMLKRNIEDMNRASVETRENFYSLNIRRPRSKENLEIRAKSSFDRTRVPRKKYKLVDVNNPIFKKPKVKKGKQGKKPAKGKLWSALRKNNTDLGLGGSSLLKKIDIQMENPVLGYLFKRSMNGTNLILPILHFRKSLIWNIDLEISKFSRVKNVFSREEIVRWCQKIKKMRDNGHHINFTMNQNAGASDCIPVNYLISVHIRIFLNLKWCTDMLAKSSKILKIKFWNSLSASESSLVRNRLDILGKKYPVAEAGEMPGFERIRKTKDILSCLFDGFEYEEKLNLFSKVSTRRKRRGVRQFDLHFKFFTDRLDHLTFSVNDFKAF